MGVLIRLLPPLRLENLSWQGKVEKIVKFHWCHGCLPLHPIIVGISYYLSLKILHPWWKIFSKSATSGVIFYVLKISTFQHLTSFPKELDKISKNFVDILKISKEAKISKRSKLRIILTPCPASFQCYLCRDRVLAKISSGTTVVYYSVMCFNQRD